MHSDYIDLCLGANAPFHLHFACENITFGVRQPQSMQRKTVIGVMGGNRAAREVAQDAQNVGAGIVREQQILLTGGKCLDRTKVKRAAMYGAEREELRGGEIARLIGILPLKSRKWDDSHPCRLFLATQLNCQQRDPINGVTPDMAIFLAGCSGTLCELAFALQAKRPVLYWKATRALREMANDPSTWFGVSGPIPIKNSSGTTIGYS